MFKRQSAMQHTVVVTFLLLSLAADLCVSQKAGYCHCSKNSESALYTLNAVVKRNGETIADFYALDSNGNRITSGCNMSNPSSTSDIMATHTVDVRGSSVVWGNRCGGEKVPGTTDTYRWRYRTHMIANFNENADVIYVCTCNFTTAIDSFLATQISVDDRISDTNAAVNDDSMVLDAYNENGVRITSAAIGQMIMLRVTYNLHSSYFDGISYPYGVYVFNVRASGTSDFQTQYTETIISSSGCPTPNADLAPATGFVKTSSSITQFITKTGKLEVATFTGREGVLYFRANTGFCSGTRSPPSDPRCENYCTSSASGRRRRQVEASNTTLYLKLNVDYPRNDADISQIDLQAVQGRSDSLETMQIVLIAILVVLSIALVFIVGCIFMAIRRRRERNEKQRLHPQSYGIDSRVPQKA